MPIRNHTGIVPYRLNGEGGGQTQQFQANASASWLMKSIPALTQGKLCNYLLGFCVTLTGSVAVGAGISGEGAMVPGSSLQRSKILTMWDLIRMVIASVEVQSAWHGTALSSQHVKGSFLELIELVGNGMERAYRRRPPMFYDAQAPGQRRYFRTSFFLPLCLLAGQKGHHTALPAVMYENAQLIINFGSGTNAWGSGIFIPIEGGTHDLRLDVSALLLPQDEVWIGPAVQWIDYQQRVSGEAVDINGLGSVTTMDRTEAGAGIAGLFWLSNRLGLPGPGLVRDITDMTFPFRDIIHTRHIDPLSRQLENVLGGCENVAGQFIGPTADGADVPSGDVGGFPYDVFDYGVSEAGDTNPLACSQPNPAVLALVCPTKDLEVTKVQQSEGTQQLQLQFADGTLGVGGNCGITHHVLACQLHSWNPEAWASAQQRLIEKGIVRKVVGTDDVNWSLKILNKQNPAGIMDRKRRFMAMKLVPGANPAPKVG